MCPCAARMSARVSPAALSGALMLLGLTLLAGQALAAVRVESDVDRYSLSTDDELELTITINMGGRDKAGKPTLEASDDFTPVGIARRESGYSMVNMHVSKYTRHVYTLRPLRAGQLKVPAATVEVNGRNVHTQPIKVQVTEGAKPSPVDDPTGPVPQPRPSPSTNGAPFAGRPPFTVVARTDKQDVFVNEQLTLECDYYTAYRLPRTPGQEAPRAEGFVAEALPDPEPEYLMVNGNQYARLTKRWALFATTPGKFEVAAAAEELMLPPAYSRQVFESNFVSVTVKPLPPQPSGLDFSGAVGRFTVQLAGDKAQVKAGEGLTLRAVVDGSGNLQTVKPPKLAVPEWCKVYESGENRTLGPRGTGDSVVFGGRAEFEYLVVPRRDGELVIPQAGLTYFDPVTKSYQTARSESVSVTVLQGEVIEDEALSGGEAAIAHIHTEDARLSGRRPILLGPTPYVVAGLCLLALFVAGAKRIAADRRRSDPTRALAATAARAAMGALKRAEREQGEAFYERLGDTVCQYIADKFGVPASGLGADDIGEALVENGAERDTADAARELLALCYACRYAPGLAGSTSRDEALARATKLVRMLESERDAR